MASRCEVVLDLDPRDPLASTARSLADQAIDEVRRIETRFSRYSADSVVSIINASAGGDAVRVDSETQALLDYADAMHADSDGRFDITSGVFRTIWNFASGQPPTAAQIDAVLPSIGWSRVERNGDMIRLPAGMQIDFGGFGKEYAADRAATLLANAGCRHALVNLGGDIRCIGAQLDGHAWEVAIQHPRDPRATIASIPVVDAAIATSGDYERFFEHEGRRYCHVIDPTTGWPVEAWQSVSVVAPVAVAAGAITTIALLKQTDAIDYLDSTGLPYLAIRADGQVLHRDIARAG